MRVILDKLCDVTWYPQTYFHKHEIPRKSSKRRFVWICTQLYLIDFMLWTVSWNVIFSFFLGYHGPLALTCLTLISAWVSNNIDINCDGNYLSIPKLQRCSRFNLDFGIRNFISPFARRIDQAAQKLVPWHESDPWSQYQYYPGPPNKFLRFVGSAFLDHIPSLPSSQKDPSKQ